MIKMKKVKENEKAERSWSPDPGNLMLVIYTLAVLMILLLGGALQADAGQVQPGQLAGEEIIQLETKEPAL